MNFAYLKSDVMLTLASHGYTDALRPDPARLHSIMQGFGYRDLIDGKANREQGISPY